MASKRGGMSPNSFGGRKRLDHLDLMSYRASATSPEKMLYLATIQDAAHNYLFFGLGRNGTSADEFASACRYFFEIRSTDPNTWPKDMVIREAKDLTEPPDTYTKSQVEGMCFDTHLSYAGLSDIISLDMFIKGLQDERRRVLARNWAQAKAYINQIHLKSYQDALLIKRTRHFKPALTDEEMLRILVKPKDNRELAMFIYRTSPTVSPVMDIIQNESHQTSVS